MLLTLLWYAAWIGVAHCAVYWNQGTRVQQPITVCFVGNASSQRPDRVKQIKDYLKEFEYAANITFAFSNTCPGVTTQNGKDYYAKDIRVVIPNISVSGTGPVPGKDCPMFKNKDGSYNHGNDGWGSWSNAPEDLTPNHGCLYNLKLGDDPWDATPYLSHTLHEFGHAMGLSHEHIRYDVDKKWVIYYFKKMNDVNNDKATNIYNQGYRNLDQIAGATLANLKKIGGINSDVDAQKLKMDATFLTKIAGVDVATAGKIYAAGFKTLSDVQKANVADLQAIPGFSNATDAQQLRNSANAVTVKRVIYGGDEKNYNITRYDRNSVMHYEYPEAGIAGNYSYAGFSNMDRLALHIMYPEKARFAEFFGTTVIKAGNFLKLWSDWNARGGNMNYAAKAYQWKIDGKVVGSKPDLSVLLGDIGNHNLEYYYSDFLNRSYSYKGSISVLTNVDFNKLMASTSAATNLPLMSYK